MKKTHVLILLLSFAVWFSLTACSSKSNQSSNENIPQNSVNTADIEKTDESEQTGESEQTDESDEADALSERLKQYKFFLQDEISSKPKSEEEGPYYLRDFCNVVVPEKDGDAIRYALFDMTGDGLPELHVLTDISYSIHTMKNNELMTWYEGDRYCRPLNNGAILWDKEAIDIQRSAIPWDRESTGIQRSYEFLDSEGETTHVVGMAAPSKDAKKYAYKYYFGIGDGDDIYDDVELSKKEWNKLAKPFLAMDSDEIIWKDIDSLDF